MVLLRAGAGASQRACGGVGSGNGGGELVCLDPEDVPCCFGSQLPWQAAGDHRRRSRRRGGQRSGFLWRWSIGGLVLLLWRCCGEWMRALWAWVPITDRQARRLGSGARSGCRCGRAAPISQCCLPSPSRVEAPSSEDRWIAAARFPFPVGLADETGGAGPRLHGGAGFGARGWTTSTQRSFRLAAERQRECRDIARRTKKSAVHAAGGGSGVWFVSIAVEVDPFPSSI